MAHVEKLFLKRFLMKTAMLVSIVPALLSITGCQSPPAKIYVAEASLPAYELIMYTHPCMAPFHVQKAWLPKGYCPVDFFVVIENQTDGELLTGKEEFSNGYNALKILLRTMDGNVYEMEKTEGTWFRNLPDMFLVIPPHGRLCWPVSLEDSHWQNMPKLRPTIEDYLSSPDAKEEEDGSFVLPPDILASITRSLEIEVKAVFRGLRDANSAKLGNEIESDWTKIMFGGVRDRRFIPDKP